jgi:hypothetical protein
MKKYFIPAVSAAVLLGLGLSSCETPAGQGAGVGAVTGAAAGALTGAAIAEDQARYYHAPPGGYPYARSTGTPGYVYSPFGPHNIIDVRGVPPGALVRDPSTGGVFRRP